MPLHPMTSDAYAHRLWEAALTRQPIAPLTEETELTIADAYAIQERLIRRTEGSVVGYKLGLTSKAKQQQMGVYEPIYGTLLSHHLLTKPELPLEWCIHPRAEPEIAVFLDRDLEGPGLTEADALQAIGWLAPAIDVIDSRYEAFRFTLPDVIADNASTAYAAIGDRLAVPGEIDLRLLGVVLEQNGEVVATATGAAVLGNPLTALAWLGNALAAQGQRLQAGQVVLTGALMAAVPVVEGDRLTASFDRLGSVSLRGHRG